LKSKQKKRLKMILILWTLFKNKKYQKIKIMLWKIKMQIVFGQIIKIINIQINIIIKFKKNTLCNIKKKILNIIKN
jgi:hypothetical protein